jgi:hypothetical protein
MCTTIKILFICGSLEPGKDGVGDYTRRLCGELIRKGNKCEIISLCDNHVNEFSTEIQEIEQTSVVVHRIPINIANKQRLIFTQEIVTQIQPDWISLQFVPYSFNPKGLPFWLPSFISKVQGIHNWHIMFHELWLGIERNASLKNICIGFFQRMIINTLVKKIDIDVINTQTELYQYKLSSLGFSAKILPLFSNISKNLNTNVHLVNQELDFKICVFGSIHFGAPVSQFIADFKDFLLQTNKKNGFKIIFIGHSGIAICEWEKALEANGIGFEKTGFVTDDEINFLLNNCSFGISTTPYILNQKSGSLATMFENKLPVICVAREWVVKDFEQSPFLNLIEYKDKNSISELVNRDFVITKTNDLAFVALNFLTGLK